MSIVAPPHVSRVKDQNSKTTQHQYHLIIGGCKPFFSCVSYFASFSGLLFLIAPSVFSNVYLLPPLVC
jgi:hypothetical protein